MTKIAEHSEIFITRARKASRELLQIDENICNSILSTLSDLLVSESDNILNENQKDTEAAQKKGMPSAMIDRLRLTKERIIAISQGVNSVIELSARLGEEISRYNSSAGIEVKRIRVPLGVICIIYESRPNVSIETSILALKSRNAIILKGGSEAGFSNQALVRLVQSALKAHGCDQNTVQLIGENGRQVVSEIISRENGVDLVIPRGGEGLIRSVSAQARVPVLKHYKGVCHLYIDKDADLEKAVKIAINAKCQRPSVCNAIEKILVHRDIAEACLPKLCPALKDKNVIIRGDQNTCAVFPGCEIATDKDWEEEYLDLKITVGVVDSIEKAIDHINKYGSHHTDAIISENRQSLDLFCREVDSGSVMRNTSTRFADGFEYGLGAELGISTDKIHARGPMGLEGLTTYKWIVESNGAVRG